MAPDVEALLGQVLDPVPAALEEALQLAGDLVKRIAALKTATDKHGDAKWFLEFDAEQALEALEKLGELIGQGQR